MSLSRRSHLLKRWRAAVISYRGCRLLQSHIMLISVIRNRLVMDVTNRESISDVQKEIKAKEGKLHILVNKCVLSMTGLRVSCLLAPL
jgi:enoyl-[acyl-carrier-protein] reductase (NADH)